MPLLYSLEFASYLFLFVLFYVKQPFGFAVFMDQPSALAALHTLNVRKLFPYIPI